MARLSALISAPKAPQYVLLVILTVIALNLLVFAPYTIYQARRFWLLSRANVTFVVKRNPKFTMVLVATFVVNSFVSPVLLYLNIKTLDYEFAVFELIHGVLFCSMSLFFTRAWLIFYCYAFEVEAVSFQWKSKMQSNDIQKFGWAHRYRWLGDAKRVTLVPLFFGLSLILVDIYYWFVHVKMTYSVTVMCSNAYIIVILILALKIRKFRDELGLIKEFRGLVVLYLCYFFLWLMILFLSTQLRGPDDISMFVAAFSTLWSYGMALMSTKFVLYQYNRTQRDRSDADRLAGYSADAKRKLSLEDVLCNEDGFDWFANHLVREFSTENILFLLQVMQTKLAIVALLSKRYNVVVSPDSEQDFGVCIKMNQQVMRSVRGNKVMENVEDLAKEIDFIKSHYISDRAIYCVNISHSVRHWTMSQQLQVVPQVSSTSDTATAAREDEVAQIMQALKIFDNALQQTNRLLLTDSFPRFRRSEEYVKLLTIT